MCHFTFGQSFLASTVVLDLKKMTALHPIFSFLVSNVSSRSQENDSSTLDLFLFLLRMVFQISGSQQWLACACQPSPQIDLRFTHASEALSNLVNGEERY
jgi:hypothetical protein